MPAIFLVLKQNRKIMKLGAFSVSLRVRNLAASRAFYEKLGFEAFGGNADQNWLILKNGDAVVGLFEGMLEENMLTFNPGWNQEARPEPGTGNVRDLQRHLRREGVALLTETDENGTGPGHFMLRDPDGNLILVDQHV